jgi:hypothetical protein
MTGMVRDAKGELNHGSDPTAGPQLPLETIGFGTALQQGRQLSEWLGSQSPRGAGWGAVAEGVGSPFTGTLHPLTDGPFADTQRRGDLALRPAFLFELPGLVTSGFLPVMR